jgi:hypothetical protein
LKKSSSTSGRTRPAGRKLRLGLAIFYAATFVAGGVALVRHTGFVGNDFILFWTAARAALDGQFPYAVQTGPGMVFKYPPWILPVLFPVALLPLATAKWVWGVLQVGCIAACVAWLLRRGCKWPVTFGVTLIFWGIWAVHALDGQITLLMLALALWCTEGLKPSSELGWRAPVLLWAFSIKIFTVFGLLGIYRPLRRWATWKRLGTTALIFTALSVPAFWTAPDRNPREVVTAWLGSAGSGGDALGEKVRSRVNQGFPVMILRVLDVRASRTSMDVLAFLLVSLILGGIWSLASAGLGFPERWAGWLALTAAVHPLSWFHSFVLAYPLAVLALDRSVKRQAWFSVALASAGILCVAVFTWRILGDVGHDLEEASIKSWGILLCLWSLKRAEARRFPVRAAARA